MHIINKYLTPRLNLMHNESITLCNYDQKGYVGRAVLDRRTIANAQQ